MNETLKSNTKPRSWYNSYSFPLVPVFVRKTGDDFNTSGFQFDWLFIRLWSLDHLSFEIAFVIDGHWGIGITAIIPYLRIVFAIPCPMSVQAWFQKYTWRKPKGSNY